MADSIKVYSTLLYALAADAKVVDIAIEEAGSVMPQDVTLC
jgi:hypothetical protein